MADSRYNVILGFSADTSKAKSEIQGLQKELNKLTSFKGGLNGFDADEKLYKATAAVKEFQIKLQSAVNTDTGKLDLSILSKSLKDSGKSLQDYAKSFKDLGPQGQQAFNSVTQAIMNAEVPLRRTNKLIQEMGVSLKNTIKWQISSSAVHAFMGAVQGAYGYVEDLNKSLNNIRIVTGRSADEMADFAKQANKAAKELSVSTTTYTDAALIYYQQGLDDEQVKQRTNTTVKMANVTGESATNVSSYMTAIWNNFDDGSKSLEYFGDVITALGAATAASSEEIAGGLEKFAAVGETVGLSYEYATAALTTIIDKTRQSEDVVGTALKTIFARIQGLQQGDTAEDGVTLNKYSAALANVGIQIMDTSGELKAMDEILNELGQRWQTLSKAEQVALAQTVGGTRQYTQLIALMDNWGAMQENLSTAYNSSGALEEQAEIYAESWEAAQQRVTTALQTIYQELLNDKFFIGVTNLVADSIELVSKLIDTVGGLPGVLAVTGVAFTTLFKNEIPQLMRGAEGFIKDLTGASKEEGYSLKEQAIYENKKMLLEDVNDKGLTEEKVNNRYASRQILITEMEKSKKYSEEEIAYYKTKIELEKQWGEEIVKRAAISDKIKEDIVNEEEKRKTIEGKFKDKERFKIAVEKRSKGEELEGFYQKEIKRIDSYNESLEKTKKLKEEEKKVTEDLEEKLGTLDNIYAENNQNMDIYNEESKKALTTVEQGFVSAGKAVASFAISVSTVTGIIGILNDDSMSFFEKIEAILPMLLVAIPSIVSTIKNATAATVLFNAEGQKGILIKTAELLLGANYNKELTKEAGLIPFLTILKEALNKSNKKGVIIKTADLIVTKLLDLAQKSLLLTFLAIAGAIAGIIVVGIALVKVWEALKNSSPEGQLKKANEELEKAKKSAQDASNAYNDLKSSIDSLKSAQDTLSGLTEGTQEWKEAVLQVNQQVLDLIEKYPELAKYMTSENGVLGISEEGLSAQMDAQYAQAQSMQLLALSKNREVIEAQANITKDKENGISYTTTGTIMVPTGEYDPVDGASYTIIEGGEETKTITPEELADIGKNILDNDAIKEDGTVDFEKIGLGNATKEFKDAINANIGEILKLAETFKQLDNEVLSLDENIASTWLRSHKTGTNSEDINFMASGMAKVLNKNRDEVEQDFKGAKDQDYIEAFAKINHTTVEAVQQSIEDGVYSIDQIKDSVIDNAALTKSQAEINEKVQEFKGVTGDKEVDQVISNLVASGGNLSVISTLETGIREKVVAAIQNNPELQAAFEKHSDYFGKDFANKIVNHLQDPEYEANMQRILDQQFNEKLESTATGLGVDKDALESYVNYLQEADDDLKGNRDAALAAAEANIKFSQGAEKVTKAFDDYKEVLEEADESTWEYHEAIAAVQEAATEMLGIEVDTNYVKEHLEDIQKAAEGDEEALTRLQQTAAKNWADNFVQGVQSVKEVVDETGKVITEGFDANTWASQFTSAVDTVAQHLGALDTSITMEADAEPALEELVNLANEAMRAGQMTQEQMQAMFGSMGYSPEVELINVPTKPQSTHMEGTFDLPLLPPLTYSGDFESTSTMQVPQIKDANGDGSTSFTKISGSNKLKSSAGKKASKGGSGGGNKKEAERYHEIKNVIKDISKELDSIGSAKDRAFGKDKLALMDQEIAKLEDMKAAQEQYLTEIEKFYDKDKKAIAKFGAEFDEEGRIINYDELMKKYGGNEEAMKALEQYEETYDLLKDKQQEIADIQNQIYDAALEKIDYKVDLQIEINSDDLEYLEFLLENLTDAAYDAADAIANLGQQAAEHLQNQEVYTQGINDIFAEHGLGDNVVDQFLNGSLTADDLADMNFTEDEVEKLREYRDGLMETSRALVQVREDVWNRVMEAVTALGDEFDKQADRVDHAIGVMDSYRNIIDIVGKDALGISDEMMKSFDEAAVDTAMDALTVSKAKYNTFLEQYNTTKAEYEAAVAAGNTEEAERLAKVLDGIEEEMQDAQNDMMSDWENALEKANQLFEENTKRILENFKDAMAGQFESLETLQDDFAKTRELDDMYVDDYKKIYELSKLTRDINRSIDETDNLAAKTALRDMQKEINDLQEAGVELSQYDLDHLRAKYELRLAEIALEDAQNAKSQVRMTRDSEGNWSYTYTADQDNIDNAQQNYEDKLYAVQELSTNYIKDLEEQILNLSSDMAEEIAAIDRTVYASEEAYNAEVQRITDFYQTKMNILSGEMDKAFANNQSLYDNDWRKYSEATGYKISADELFLTKFGETALGTKSGFDTMQGYQEAFNTAIGSPDTPGTLLGDLSQNYKDWQTKVDDVMKTAGTSMDTFKETASDVLEDTKKKTDEVANSMDNEKDPKGLKQKAKAAFDAALKAAQDFEKAYGPEIDKVITKNTNLVTSLNNIIGKWGEIKTAADNATTAAKNYNQYASNPSTVGGGGKGGGHSGGGTIDTDKNKTPTTTGSNNSNSYGGWILTGARNSNGYYMIQNLKTNHYASAVKTGGKNSEGKTQYQIVSGDEKNKYLYFDTGGYTGEWGSSGRLAMLHEKELVLNADDTKNMFSIIDAVRDIVKSIDLNANTGGFGLGNLISAMIPSSESNLNQNVEIKAEFPNVTDRGEIEAAFDNLINKASQYANRK